MPKLIFELDNAEEEDRALDADTLIHVLHDKGVAYESLRAEGETIGVNFANPEDAKWAFKVLDGIEILGSFLHIKPSRKVTPRHSRGGFSRRDDRFSQEESDNEDEMSGRQGGCRYDQGSPPPPKLEQYPCRILIPTDMIKVVLGKKGSTISGIQERTNTKIDIHRDKGPVRGRPSDDTLTTIKGQNEDFSNACKEIITVIDDEYQKMNLEERKALQLKLLVHDSLCGRVIGKGGHNLKQVRTETGAKLIISNSIFEDYSLYDHGSGGMLCSGERIITIEGSVDSILHAEEIISKKLRHFLERDLKGVPQGPSMVTHQPQFIGGPGILSSGACGYPPIMFQRPPYGQTLPSYGPYMGMSGYAGYAGPAGFMNSYPGILGPGFPPLQSLVPQPHPSHNDQVETSSVIIPTKEVGAVIGRKGEYISRVKQYSGAQVRVIKGEEGGDSRVEIVGTPDSQWKAQLCVYTKIKEGMKVPYSEARLKTEYLVPAVCVGRIIGKKGQVVQDIQDKSQTDIEAPKDKQGGSDVPIYITGTFNGLQVTLNRVREIVSRTLSKETQLAP